METINLKNNKWQAFVGNLFRGSLFEETLTIIIKDDAVNRDFDIYNDLMFHLVNNNVPYFVIDYSFLINKSLELDNYDLAKQEVEIALDYIQNNTTYKKFILWWKWLWWILALENSKKLEGIRWICLISTWYHDFDLASLDRYTDFANPALIMHGTEDKRNSIQNSKDLSSKLSKAEYMVFDWADDNYSHPRDYRRMLTYSIDFIFKNK